MATRYCFTAFFLMLATGLLAQPAAVLSVYPLSGPVGTTVTLSGAGFSPRAADNVVFFGVAKATVLSASPTALTVTVPAAATYGPISVSVQGLTTVAKPFFSITAPPPYPAFSSRSFAPRTDLPTGTYPNFVTSGDVDGDLWPDLLVLNQGSHTISVFRNAGTPGTLAWEGAVDFAAGTNPMHAVLGDMNGDGKPDLAITDYDSSRIVVYTNCSAPGHVAFSEKLVLPIALYHSPISLGIADFDGDGRPDIAAVNSNGYSVSVFKNMRTTDTLRFAGRTDFPVGKWPKRCTIADFNGDGKPDIAVPDQNDNTISVLKNTSSNGLISFAPRETWSTGPEPFAASAADLNGDGLPDLIVANSDTGTFSIFKNTGTDEALSFAPKMDVVAGTQALYPAPADLDGDGKVDFAGIAWGTAGLVLFRNTGTADSIAFAAAQEYTTGNVSRSAAVADLNRDRQPEIFFVNSINKTVSVLRNTMRPVPVVHSFSPAVATASDEIFITGTNLAGTTGVSLGGVPVASFVATDTLIRATPGNAASGDVVVTTPSGSAVVPGFKFSIPAPLVHSFTPASGAVGTTVSIRGKHFRQGTSEPVVYFGAVKGAVSAVTDTLLTVQVPVGATFQPLSVTTKGMTEYASQPFRVTFPGRATGIRYQSFRAKKDVAAEGNPRSMAVADFDGDGKADLFVTNQSAARASVYRNTSSLQDPTLEGKVELMLENEPFDVAAADFDGDGKIDVAITHLNGGRAGTVAIKRNESTPGAFRFSEAISLPVGNGVVGLAVANLDGDGKPDLVVTAGNSGFLALFKNTSDTLGNIAFAHQGNLSTLNHSDRIVAADLNGDGKMELISADFSNQSFSVWTNTTTNENFSFSAPRSFAAGRNPVDISAADLDGDGKTDIVVANYSSSSVSVFRNTGSAGAVAFAPAQDYTTGENPRSVTLGDVDGDGLTDLLVSYNTPAAVALFKNVSGTGRLSFTLPIVVSTGNEPVDIALADLDGDSKPELMVANSYSLISVFRNQVYEPVLASFSPGTARMNTVVKISGENLALTTSVSFGGTPAASFTVVADTLLTATVGAGSSGLVLITTPHGTDSLNGFTYIPPAPKMHSFNPASATVGTEVRIAGQYLGSVSAVRFGAMPAAKFSILSDSVIVATVGRGASGTVLVTGDHGADSLDAFTYIQPEPQIRSFTPASGTVGTEVRIVGHQLGNVVAVRFGAMPAAGFTIVSDTLITATVGKGTSGNITATNEYGTDTAGPFQFVPPVPKILAFTPTAAPAGTTITVRGKNFTWTDGLLFGQSAAASYQVVSDSVLTAVVGQGSTGAVRVRTEFGSDSLGAFIFLDKEALLSYPNPANGAATIAHGPSDKQAQLLLVDVNGRVVKTIAVAPQQAQTKLDLALVQPGIYKVVWTDGKTSRGYTIYVQ